MSYKFVSVETCVAKSSNKVYPLTLARVGTREKAGQWKMETHFKNLGTEICIVFDRCLSLGIVIKRD